MIGSRTGLYCGAAILACAPAPSFAQHAAKDYPAKFIRLIVP